jgi:predicted RNA-binding protein YlxR (DUF448 family)
MKKNNQRTCIATKKVFNKTDLIRIVKTKDQSILIDLEFKISGRGAYISKDTKGLEILKKQKLLNKVFRMPVDEAIYIELENIIKRSDADEK